MDADQHGFSEPRQAPPNAPTPAPMKPEEWWAIITGLLGVTAVILWIVAASKLKSDRIESIADEEFALVMPWVAWAVAATVATFTVAAVGLLSRRN